MTSKPIAWAIVATLFTISNLVALAANWSITANAKVAGMSFLRLEKDTDFRQAVVDVLAGMDHSTLEHNDALRAAIVDVVESCHLSYAGSNNIKC